MEAAIRDLSLHVVDVRVAVEMMSQSSGPEHFNRMAGDAECESSWKFPESDREACSLCAPRRCVCWIGQVNRCSDPHQQPADDREAHTRSASLATRGDEWLEDPVAVTTRHRGAAKEMKRL
jgi:hypothetical protein